LQHGGVAMKIIEIDGEGWFAIQGWIGWDFVGHVDVHFLSGIERRILLSMVKIF